MKRKDKTFGRLLREISLEPIKAKDRDEYVTTKEAIVQVIRDAAVKGNPTARKFIVSRISEEENAPDVIIEALDDPTYGVR